MAHLTTISENLFNRRAQEAMDRQPLRKVVYTSELTLIDENALGYRDLTLKMSKGAFGDLLKALKIPKGFVQKFTSIVEDEAQRQSFINTIKRIMSSRGSGAETVALVLNPSNKEVIAIKKNARSLISNASVLDVTDRIINESNLSVADFVVNNDGSIVINTVLEGNQFEVAGLKDEVFQAGISFTNNTKDGFIVSPYINRMVCANGMISRGLQEQYKLTSVQGDALEKFYMDINNLAEKGFQPAGFVEQVQSAHSIKASLAEMYHAARAIRNAVPTIQPEELENWLPVIWTNGTYKAAGIDTKFLRAPQLKNAATDTTKWEIISGLTHFATHHNGFLRTEISDYSRKQLQVVAGQMLTEEHDLSNFVPNPFGSTQGKKYSTTNLIDRMNQERLSDTDSVQAENAF